MPTNIFLKRKGFKIAKKYAALFGKVFVIKQCMVKMAVSYCLKTHKIVYGKQNYFKAPKSMQYFSYFFFQKNTVSNLEPL